MFVVGEAEVNPVLASADDAQLLNVNPVFARFPRPESVNGVEEL